MEEKKFALLIDAENTSARYIETIINELKEYGTITYQRMYGDFTKFVLSDWNKKALEYAVVPIQQPRYSTAKNAADIMLVIDAMDILYQKNVDGFCIVSSDSDFTRLANRLRESGMIVIGMGNSKASKTFIKVCNEYKYLDKIAEEGLERELDEEIKTDAEEEVKNSIEKNHDKPSDKNNTEKEKNSITPLNRVKNEINNIIQINENNGTATYLASLKSSLQRRYNDFDERNYGYNSMKKFVQEATKFKIVQNGSVTTVVRDNDKYIEDISVEVEIYIKMLADSENGIELGSLGQKIKQKYADFKYKDLGYSRLSSYVKSIEGITVGKNNIVKTK